MGKVAVGIAGSGSAQSREEHLPGSSIFGHLVALKLASLLACSLSLSLLRMPSPTSTRYAVEGHEDAYQEGPCG